MTYKIAILGGGPGGYVAAVRAAQLGAKVAVIEKTQLGGTCLNRGCIPTKALVAGAEAFRNVKKAGEFGIKAGNVSVDFIRLMERKNQVVERLRNGIHYLFQKNKIDLHQGTGKLISFKEIQIIKEDGTKEVITAENIIIATGSEPALLPSLGCDGEMVITSNEALKLSMIPSQLVVIGGGVIGCEFASIFAELGSRVTIVEAMANILPSVDKEVARLTQSLFKRRGITVKTKAMVKEVRKRGPEMTVLLDNGEEVAGDKVLISIGRVLNNRGLGLEDLGIALGPQGEITVNDRMQTNIPHIYAIGDITNKMQLAHVASAQGLVAAENIMGLDRIMDYKVVPNCIYTFPEIAGVGITGQEAEEQGRRVKTGKFPVMASGKAQAMGETEGFVKVLADPDTDLILGVHIVGPHATDLIGEAALAIKTGITAGQLVQTIHAHPTLSETLAEAMEAVHGRSIHT